MVRKIEMTRRILTFCLWRNINPSCLTSFIRLASHKTASARPRSVTDEDEKILSEEISKSRVKNYAVSRYMSFVSRYLAIFEQRFPKAVKLYRIFTVGIKDFFSDTKDYVRVAKHIHLSQNDFRELKHRDIKIYYQMPKDMKKMSPVLLISALPFANYVIFPIAYLLPKLLLSSHFWSMQQRSQFAVADLKKRLYNCQPVFRNLQLKLDDVADPVMQEKCKDVYVKLGSGSHAAVEEILEIKPTFQAYPYKLNLLYPNHVNALLRLHGLSTFGLFKYKKLAEKASVIHELDLALLRDGISTFDKEELECSCFLRGLNATKMSREDMVMYLESWTAVSKTVDTNSYSLLLHCPIFLAYNNPTNWQLIY